MRFIKVCSVISTIIVVGLSSVLGVSGQSRVDPSKVSIVYHAPGMERAIIHAGVVFDKTTPVPLSLDAYIPRSMRKDELRPAIVFVGGAERVREWKWFITWGQAAAANGFIGIIPDKRYARGLDGTRTGFSDTEKLLKYLKTDGHRLGIDARRLCLWTFSAGGRLTSVGLKPDIDGVRCLVSFYSLLDMAPELAEMSNKEEREALLRQFSPLNALEALAASGRRAPPMFIARAGRDSAFINAGIDNFLAAAVRLNAHVSFINYEQGDHGFDGVNNTPQSRAIIEAALSFVREHTSAQ